MTANLSISTPIDTQRGFSLIEVSIVTAIILLVAIVAIPTIGNYVVENRVPKVGAELARFIVQTKVNAPSGSATPYSDIKLANFSNLITGSSIFAIASDGKVLHGLGSGGEVTVAPVAGTSFSVTLSKVSNAACPGIASVMQRVSDAITVTPESGTPIVLKSSTVPYSAVTAESKCAKGDVNTFVFTAS